MKQNSFLYKTSHISYSKTKSSSAWQHNSCLLVNTGNYFISSTTGHFATFDMCWHFCTGLQLSFNTVISHSTRSGNTCLHTNQKSWSGHRFTKSGAAVHSFQAAWLYQEGTRRRGREVCRSWGISRSPPGIAALMGSTGISSLFGADPSLTTLMESMCPGHCWLSPARWKPCACLFRGLIFGTLLWKDYTSVCWFAKLLLGFFSSPKERSTFNFKACAACIFCISYFKLACSEINQCNI